MSDYAVGKYNMPRRAPVSGDAAAAGTSGAVTTVLSRAGSHKADDPMVWLFGLAAVTVGLVAFSTHVRVGKVNASLSAG